MPRRAGKTRMITIGAEIARWALAYSICEQRPLVANHSLTALSCNGSIVIRLKSVRIHHSTSTVNADWTVVG